MYPNGRPISDVINDISFPPAGWAPAGLVRPPQGAFRPRSLSRCLRQLTLSCSFRAIHLAMPAVPLRAVGWEWQSGWARFYGNLPEQYIIRESLSISAAGWAPAGLIRGARSSTAGCWVGMAKRAGAFLWEPPGTVYHSGVPFRQRGKSSRTFPLSASGSAGGPARGAAFGGGKAPWGTVLSSAGSRRGHAAWSGTGS